MHLSPPAPAVTYASVRSKAVVLLLLIRCLLGFFVCLCFSMHYIVSLKVSSFAIILKRKRELVALLLLSYECLVTVNVLWLFLTVPRVGLQCVTVVFPDNSHLFLD